MVRQVTSAIIIIIKSADMSSPTKVYQGSPILRLEDRYSSRNINAILEEERSAALARNLLLENESLNSENLRLQQGFRESRKVEAFYSKENELLKKDESELRLIIAGLRRDNEIKTREIELLTRDIGMIREHHTRDTEELREANRSLSAQNALLERKNAQQIASLRAKYLYAAEQETTLAKQSMSEDLNRLLTELETTHQLLVAKQAQLQHLSVLNSKNSLTYSQNLQTLISENNVLRNKLANSEMAASKELQHAELRKELEKSRTIGIMSYCKENSVFVEKEITRLAEQLLDKNIAIEAYVKEIEKMKKSAQAAQKRYETTKQQVELTHAEQVEAKEKALKKIEQYYKSELIDQKTIQVSLEEQLATLQNDYQALQRNLSFHKGELEQRGKDILELKQNLSKMHEDHSKEISKVMTESKVRRRSSGLHNSSMYSSGSIDIDDGHPITSSIKLTNSYVPRDISLSNEGVGSQLPTVKEQMAVSNVSVHEDGDDIELKELMLHYETMLQQVKKNKTFELQLAAQKIDSLKATVNEKQQEILDILNRFSPLMEYKINPGAIDEERKRKIEMHYRADVDILGVMLRKFGIVALEKRE